jgi:hypothetical protein
VRRDDVERGRPFDDYLVDDVVRLCLLSMGIFLIMLAARIAWLRFRAPAGDALKDSSPLALLSYALFALVPTLQGFQSFGKPLGPFWPIYLAALGTGTLAAFGQVTFRQWFHHGRHLRPKADR